MIILDTNIVSEPMSNTPSKAVIDWLDRQEADSLFLAAPVVAELSSGAFEFARRTGSSRYLTPLDRLLSAFEGRIVSFGPDAAYRFGQVIAQRHGMGRPILPFDAMIAAIAIEHDATLATRSIRDFEGLDLKLSNPFEQGA